jgi:SAM-dependent methyltransferase
VDIREHNRRAWDQAVEQGSPWAIPVTAEVVAAARRGEWSVVLTENTPVPRSWFPAQMAGARILCLASGGGQQAPVLAAAGASVVLLDNSPKQLARDQAVAKRDGLSLETVEGDMRNLSAFTDACFDLVFHPVSNLFIPDVRPVWAEAYRVLRVGGALLAGFMNPFFYLFDRSHADRDELLVRHRLPYSDLDSLTPTERQALLDTTDVLEWSHTLTDQIGGQIDAGFVIAGFYEDRHKDHPLAKHAPTYAATKAVKI